MPNREGRRRLRRGVDFPSMVQVGPWSLHPHLVFEVLAYAIAFQLFLLIRSLHRDPLDGTQRWTLIAAALAGAAVGAKVLYWLIDPADVFSDAEGVLGGKTIVGALLGGHLGVELAKRLMGIHVRTGDPYALPAAVGIAVGRLGCFFSGLPDRTHGVHTALPWGIDLGDGARHPTALYELAFLVALAVFFVMTAERPWPAGSRWRIFLGTYCAWRVAVGFIQPLPTWAGMSAIQWACAAYLLFEAQRWLPRRGAAAATHA